MLLACSGVPLTPEGQRVRRIETQFVNTCRFITSEELTDNSFAVGPGICTKRAYGAMKNRVAELGGNAYVIAYEIVMPCIDGGTTLGFEAYRCAEP
jgi:hypothetical protein